MSPRTKISLGIIAILAGVVSEEFVGHLVIRHLQHHISTLESMPVETLTKVVNDEIAWVDERTHIGFNPLTLCYLIILAGVIVLLLGVFQNARATERLKNNLPRSS